MLSASSSLRGLKRNKLCEPWVVWEAWAVWAVWEAWAAWVAWVAWAEVWEDWVAKTVLSQQLN